MNRFVHIIFSKFHFTFTLFNVPKLFFIDLLIVFITLRKKNNLTTKNGWNWKKLCINSEDTEITKRNKWWKFISFTKQSIIFLWEFILQDVLNKEGETFIRQYSLKIVEVTIDGSEGREYQLQSQSLPIGNKHCDFKHRQQCPNCDTGSVLLAFCCRNDSASLWHWANYRDFRVWGQGILQPCMRMLRE